MILDSNLVCGYTCQDHLLVDLDNCNYRKARRLAVMIMKWWPALGNCLVVRSSVAHYHLIFDAIVEWSFLVHVIECLAAVSIVERNYAQVRTFRRDLTLRISEKRGEDRLRPVPVPFGTLSAGQSFVSGGGIDRYLKALSAFRKIDIWNVGAALIK